MKTTAAKAKEKQEVIYENISHPGGAGNGWLDSHLPLHDYEVKCAGCDTFRSRRAAHHRSGKVLGISVRGEYPDQPAKDCPVCHAACYAGHSEHIDVWAWSFSVDANTWAIEERQSNSPPAFCPRCRKSVAEKE